MRLPSQVSAVQRGFNSSPFDSALGPSGCNVFKAAGCVAALAACAAVCVGSVGTACVQCLAGIGASGCIDCV